MSDEQRKQIEGQSENQPVNDAHHDGELSDEELSNVSGGAEPSGKKKKGSDQQEFLVVKLEDVLISGVQ